MIQNYTIFYIFLISLSCRTLLGNIPDSLENRLNEATSDTAKAMLYNHFARGLMSGKNRDVARAMQYAQNGLKLAEQALFESGCAELHRTIGNACYFQNDYEQAIEHYKIALDICVKTQNTDGMALNYYNMGISYRTLSKNCSSLDYLYKALSLWKQLGNINYKITAYRSIIQIYQDVGELNLAESYAMKAIQLAIANGNRQQEASLYELMARINFSVDNTKVAEYFQKSLQIYEELNDQLQIARITHNIAVRLYADNPEASIALLRKTVTIYERISPDNSQLFDVYNSLANEFHVNHQDDSTRHYKEKALSKAILSGNMQTMANAYYAIGSYYMEKGNVDRAKKDFHKSYDIALKYGLCNVQSNALSGLSSVNYRQGDYKTAIEYLKKHQAINDSLDREENRANIQQLTMQHEFNKDMTEKRDVIKTQLERQQQANKYQKIIVTIVSIALICAAIFLVFIIHNNKLKKHANMILKEQNEKIILQRDMIARQNKEITDSIIYARRIQKAILPAPGMLKDDLEMYIFYRPRDIVSGDFYWMAKKDDKLIIVAADCTGHGVPGAFMSILGVTFLNEIVGKENEVYANEILNKLRDNVVHSLNQTGRLTKDKVYTRDGMDIALCVIDYPRMFLQYAGAYNPLILIRNGELREIKANRMPVAYSDEHEKKKFTNNLISLMPKDCIYIFSDGFADQFGGSGEKSKKYSGKKLKSTLLHICNLSMKKQEKIMARTYDEWKGDNEQVDDVLLIGIRI